MLFEDSINKVNQEQQQAFSGTLQKWRRILFKTNMICALFTFGTEVGMYFVFKARNLFLHPIPDYLFRFLILPTIIDLLIIVVGIMVAQKNKGKPNILNYIPILQLTGICFMVSTIHHVFSVTFCTFLCPIFLTVIFNDRKMTRNITVISLICLTIAQFIGPAINGVRSEYLVPEYFVGIIALLSSYVVCKVLQKFQEENDRILQTIYKSKIELSKMLSLDQKTGLYGFTALNNYLDTLFKQQNFICDIGLAIIDIDDFKKINDSYGHIMGDNVIHCLAEILKEYCQDEYMPVRFGGEEFAIVFTGGKIEEYEQVLEKIRVAFEEQKYDFTEKTITLSAGLAIWRPEWDRETFMNQADQTMYRSKHNGKNCTSVYKLL